MDTYKVIDVREHPGDSAFLIDNGKTAIMYDSGFAFTGYKIANKIKNILKKRDLDFIFLTHSHYDHVLGSVYALKYWPNAKVVAGEYAAEIFEKTSAKAVMRDLDKKIANQCSVTEYEDLTDNLKVDIPVLDGDIIKAGDMEFIAYNLPGHTKCSFGYYCPENKLFLNCETPGVFNGRNDVVPSFLVGYNMTINSIERIKQLDIENILMPHYGLLDREQTKIYLERSKNSAIETANEIIDMFKENKADDEIAEYFKNKFYHGYIKDIYPIDAMKLNTGIMINLLRKEFNFL